MGNFVDVHDDLRAWRAEPEGTPRAGIILIHEIWGLVGHIRDVADRFAAEGYLVLAPDVLSVAGTTPDVGEELQAVMADPDQSRRDAAQPRLREALAPLNSPEFAATTIASLRTAVDALEAELGQNAKIAVVGFCFGGTYSFQLAAADSRVQAAVPFYGRAPEVSDIPKISCPVLAIYGQHDPALIDNLPAVREAMRSAGVDFTDQVYPDAAHAFFNDQNPIRYRADDAADAWRRALNFLQEHVG